MREIKIEMFREAYKNRFCVNPEILEILAADTEKVCAIVMHKNGKIAEKRTFTAWYEGYIGDVGIGGLALSQQSPVCPMCKVNPTKGEYLCDPCEYSGDARH